MLGSAELSSSLVLALLKTLRLPRSKQVHMLSLLERALINMIVASAAVFARVK